MTRRERLMATLAGLPVDRPAVSFYELNALDQDPGDSAPYNIYSHPSWKALLDLTREKTDRIVMRGALPVLIPTPCVHQAGTLLWEPDGTPPHNDKLTGFSNA